MEAGDALREQAASWSLSGDRQLLDMLQQMHQKVVKKSQEASTKLEEMMSSIQDASVALCNVNNRFMGLSNSQFIESRVYDDEDDVTDDSTLQVVEPKPLSSSPGSVSCVASVASVSNLLQSIATLEQLYEEVTILPDDTSDDTSGSDDQLTHSIVLKPKDMYSERPLPHLIGTKLWYSKWHAGLLEEESDTESVVSRRDSETEPYSDGDDDDDNEPSAGGRQESFTSESIAVSEESYKRTEPINANTQPIKPQSQSSLAAELARRLGGEPSQQVAHTTAVAEHKHTNKPAGTHMFSDQIPPIGARIFSDSPPPLLPSDDDDDIFSDMNRSIQHSSGYNNQQVATNTHIFDDQHVQTDIFDDFSQPSINKSTPSAQSNNNVVMQKEREEKHLSKKPAGAVSLFGNKSGTEIGTAILKRNQKQSTSSDEETDVKPKFLQKPHSSIKEISKTEDVNKASLEIQETNDNSANLLQVKEETKKLLLKDDIFDDIDDIFATDAPKIISNTNLPNKNIFDENDDLFGDLNFETSKISKNPETDIKTTISDFKDIFADDDEDDLFSDIKIDKGKTIKTDTKENIIESKKVELKTENINIITPNESQPTQEKVHLSDTISNKYLKIQADLKSTSKNEQSPLLFDEDDDVDNLFGASSNKNKDIEADMPASQNKSSIEKIVENKMEVKPIETQKSAEECSSYINESIVNPEIKEPNLETSETSQQDNSENINIFTTIKTTNHSFENKKDEDAIKNTNSGNNYSFENEIDELFTKTNTKNPEQNYFAEEINEEINIGDGFAPKNDNTVVNQPMNFENINTTSSEQEFSPKQKSPDSTNIPEDSLFTTPKNSFMKEEFTSIFHDHPPVFEKSKDSKKSKNINALFDDDSDDEALFFKKSDNFEDKIDDNEFGVKSETSPNFGLFLDKPPELKDDIFGKRAEKSESTNLTHIDDTTMNTPSEVTQISQSSIFTEISVIDLNTTKCKETPDSNESKDNTDSASKLIDKKPIGRIKSNININVNTLLPGASPKKTVKITEDQQIIKSPETNVSAGKSIDNNVRIPKSASFEDVPDSSVLCNKLSKERPRIQVKRRPSSRKARQDALKKSNTDSELNKSDDFTDTSNKNKDDDVTFGISTLGNCYKTRENLSNEDTIKDKIKTDNVESDEPDAKKLSIFDDDDDDDIFNSYASKTTTKHETKNKPENKLSDSDIFTTEKIQANVITNINEPKAKTLTIVDYDDDIFNSFASKSTKSETKDEPENMFSERETATSGKLQADKIIDEPKAKSLTIVDDDDDIFKAFASNTNKDKTIIKADSEEKSNIFSSYDKDSDGYPSKSNKQIKDKLEQNSGNLSDEEDIFSDFAVKPVEVAKIENKNVQRHNSLKQTVTSQTKIQDDLFKTDNIKKDTRSEQKVSLFDSSSDEELFGAKPTGVTNKHIQKRNIWSDKRETLVKSAAQVETKHSSLFGDDSDDSDDSDDDLFSQHTKTQAPRPAPSGCTSDKPQPTTELVFDDPLTLLGKDEQLL